MKQEVFHTFIFHQSTSRGQDRVTLISLIVAPHELVEIHYFTVDLGIYVFELK